MFCPNCGKEIGENFLFCKECGTPVKRPEPPITPPEMQTGPQTAPVITEQQSAAVQPGPAPQPANEAQPVQEQFPAMQPQPAPESQRAQSAQPLQVQPPATVPQPAPDAGQKQKKPKKKKGKLIAISLIVVFVGIIAGLAIYMFPLKLSADISSKKLKTTESVYNLDLKLKANQPILSATYSYESETAEGGVATGDVTLSSGLLSKDASVKGIPVLPGSNTVTLTIKTLFGSQEKKLTITREIGFTTAPDEDALVPIDEVSSLISNELILVFTESASQRDIDDLIENYGGTVVGRIYDIGEYHVRFSGYGEYFIYDLKDQLENEPIVEDVYLSFSHKADPEFYPNDPKFDSWNSSSPAGNNWWLEAIDAPEAWEHRHELKNIKVGVIDTWLEYDHEDIQVNQNKISILPTEDFSSIADIHRYYDENVGSHTCRYNARGHCIFCDMKDHGTHCSGIIGARSDNNKGISGVAPNADLHFATWWYLYKEPNGQMSNASSTDGFLYNLSHLVASGCRVISISVGSHTSIITDEEREDARRINGAIERLEKRGYDFLIFKAAGNDTDNASNDRLTRMLTTEDCADRHVVVVGAMQNSSSLWDSLVAWTGGFEKIYRLAYFSNYGDDVDVVAPGVDVYSTVRGSSYRNMDGTSMATPLAAGVACLIYGANPNLTYDYVKTILKYDYKNLCTDRYTSKYYHVVNANNVVEWALQNGQNLPPVEEPALGFATGVVQDAKTLQPIANAAVQITSVETGEGICAESLEGLYNVVLKPGFYNMEFYAPDYITETIYNIEITAGGTTYNVLLNMVEDEIGTGTASGRIVNAFDASSVTNAKISFYKGINNASGEPVKILYSDGYGYYHVELEPGNYTIRTQAEGFYDSSAVVLIISGESRDYQDCSMTPVLKEGEIRAVLTWGQFPLDLDSHLNGPSESGGRFHVYFENKDHYYNGLHYVKLDVDDTDSYGPETTSVYIGSEGKYVFSVHDYSNRHSSYSTALSLSGAQIKLYIAGRSDPIIYNVPNLEGTLWTVFSVEDGEVTSINTMSYESNPRTVGN